MSNPFTTQYSDTPNGVLQFLIEGVGIETDGIKEIIPIPSTRGVWGVILTDSGVNKPSIIVWLKGHSKHHVNEFECDEYAENTLM